MPILKCREISLKEYTFSNDNIIGPMSSSYQSTTMSLEQAKNNYRKMVTHFLTYFTISQIVSGKASLYNIV